jgi:hypothetical protein
MSYHHLGQGPAPKTSDEVCFPRDAVLRMQPRAAGPMRELVTLSGRAGSASISWDRGMLVIDPRYDDLPLGPGWEWRT